MKLYSCGTHFNSYLIFKLFKLKCKKNKTLYNKSISKRNKVCWLALIVIENALVQTKSTCSFYAQFFYIDLKINS